MIHSMIEARLDALTMLAMSEGVDPSDDEAMEDWIATREGDDIDVSKLQGISRYIYRLQDDDLLALQLEAAQTHGIGLSMFLNWSPKDQDAAMAFIIHQRAQEGSRCQFCGTKDDDWVDPATKRLHTFPPYTAEGFLCYGCQALHKVKEDITTEERPFIHPRIVPIEE